MINIWPGLQSHQLKFGLDCNLNNQIKGQLNSNLKVQWKVQLNGLASYHLMVINSLIKRNLHKHHDTLVQSGSNVRTHCKLNFLNTNYSHQQKMTTDLQDRSSNPLSRRLLDLITIFSITNISKSYGSASPKVTDEYLEIQEYINP
jgi:hypothetical protein